MVLALAYVVFVGTTHVPSPRRKEVCLPAVGAGTNPADPAAEDVAPPMLLYVVLGGVCHVPSPRRYLACAPAAGAGTKPAFPDAEAEAAPILVYVVLVSVHGTFTYILPFPSRATG